MKIGQEGFGGEGCAMERIGVELEVGESPNVVVGSGREAVVERT